MTGSLKAIRMEDLARQWSSPFGGWENITLGPRQLLKYPSTARSRQDVSIICRSSHLQARSTGQDEQFTPRPGTSTSHVGDTEPGALTCGASAQIAG
jgi:hypothetical protein